MQPVDAIIFDVGNVLYQWDIRTLYAKLIDDPAELDHFLANVLTIDWHSQHDAGRSALAGLEATVGLVDHIGAAATTDHAVVAMTILERLQRIANLHDVGP